MLARTRSPEPWDHPAYFEMRQRIETLEEENRQLRELLAPPLLFPPAWRLSAQQANLLAVLHSRPGLHGREALRAAVCGLDGEQYEQIIAVLVYKCRAKLRETGITILTIWARGYALTAESHAVIDAALADVAAGRIA